MSFAPNPYLNKNLCCRCNQPLDRLGAYCKSCAEVIEKEVTLLRWFRQFPNDKQTEIISQIENGNDKVG